MILSRHQEVVYEPDARRKDGFLASLFLVSGNVWHSRELIWQLFRRDFFASYRKSFLGAAWLIIAPVFSILSWVFMNATGVLNPGDVGMPYPAFVLMSTAIWGLFLGFYQAAAETLNAGSGFILQVRYSHEALFAKQVLQQAANFIVNFSVILVALALLGVLPSWQTVFLPVLALPLLLLGAGIGLFVSLVGVVATEVRKATDILMGMLVFFTPVIYSASAVQGSVGVLVKWNPLTYLVGGVRDVVAFGRLDQPETFLLVSLGALAAFLVSVRLFFLAEGRVIEKMI